MVSKHFHMSMAKASAATFTDDAASAKTPSCQAHSPAPWAAPPQKYGRSWAAHHSCMAGSRTAS